jgi:hypothetical protein
MSRLSERSLESARTPESQLKLVPAPAAPEQKHYLSRGTPAFRNASIALFLSGFATFSLLYCVQPLMPLFAHDFNITPAVSSLSLSVSTGFLAFAIFCAAAVSERFGRKTLMFVSLLGSALCTIASAIVPDWHMLLLIRALQGLLLGGVPAVAMTYLAEEIDRAGSAHRWGFILPGTHSGAWQAASLPERSPNISPGASGWRAWACLDWLHPSASSSFCPNRRTLFRVPASMHGFTSAHGSATSAIRLCRCFLPSAFW